MRRLISFFAIVFLITSCSIVATHRFSSGLIGFGDNSNEGMIIGSITFKDETGKFNAYFPNIYSYENNKSTEFEISPSNIGKNNHKGELQNGKTYLFAITKKPGKYEINNIRFSKILIGGGLINENFKNFAIPIDIEKGKIKYIGEITIDDNTENSDIINLKDEFERDLIGIKKKEFRTKIDWDSTIKSSIEIIKK